MRMATGHAGPQHGGEAVLNLVLAGSTFTQRWQCFHLVLLEELTMVCLFHSDFKTCPYELHELFDAKTFFPMLSHSFSSYSRDRLCFEHSIELFWFYRSHPQGLDASCLFL